MRKRRRNDEVKKFIFKKTGTKDRVIPIDKGDSSNNTSKIGRVDKTEDIKLNNSGKDVTLIVL